MVVVEKAFFDQLKDIFEKGIEENFNIHIEATL